VLIKKRFDVASFIFIASFIFMSGKVYLFSAFTIILRQYQSILRANLYSLGIGSLKWEFYRFTLKGQQARYRAPERGQDEYRQGRHKHGKVLQKCTNVSYASSYNVPLCTLYILNISHICLSKSLDLWNWLP
jgi:hypothetical protein